MIFSVIYRNKSGALQEECIEAESRSACISALRRQGIVAISIREGKGGGVNKGSKSSNQKAGLAVKVSITVMIVLVVTCGIWLWIGRDNTQSLIIKDKVQASTKAPSVSQRQSNSKTNNAHRKSALIETAVLPDMAKGITKPPKPLPPPAITNYMVGITITTNKPKNVFRSATEKMLYSLFSTPIGSPPPPMGRIPLRDKAELDTILNTAFEQGSSKDAKRQEMEQTVDAARKVFKEYIEKGGTPDEFMEYFRDKLVQYHEEWKMSQKVAMAACRDEDPEVARAMVDEVNARLAEKGIKPVVIPPKFKERIGIPVDSKAGENK